MNEMNSLETQLHSWQPRRPSAGLERRLFGTPFSLMPKMAWFVGWLVPATACVLLTFSVFTARNVIPGGSSGVVPLAAMLQSNQGFLESAPNDLRKGQNNWTSVTFDWTNRSGSTSSINSLPRSRMN